MLPLSEFYVDRRRGKPFAACKPCHNNYTKACREKRGAAMKREAARRYSLTPRGRASGLLAHSRTRARKGGLPHELDLDWVAGKIAAGRCEATGIPFVLEHTGRGRPHPFTPSLDQHRAGRGYTKRNTRVVVWAYNRAKSDWGEGVFATLARAYTNHNGG